MDLTAVKMPRAKIWVFGRQKITRRISIVVVSAVDLRVRLMCPSVDEFRRAVDHFSLRLPWGQKGWGTS